MFASSKDVAAKKKDFSWKRRKQNPFWKGTEEVDWKKRIEIAIFSLAIFTMILLGLFHPFFHIKNIEITGVQRISEIDLSEATQGVINYRRWLVCPGKSYFMANIEEVRDIIKDKFPIESIIIKKTLSHKIHQDIIWEK